MISRSTLQGHEDSVFAVSWSPDGTRLATASRDKMAFVWNVDGQIERWLPLDSAGVAVSFSHDGMFVATGASNGTATVWRVDDGTRVDALQGDPLDTLAFRPGTTELFVGRADGTITSWHPTSGRVRGTYALAPGADRVTSIDFVVDGAAFAAASQSGALALVDADSLSALAAMKPESDGLTVYRCVIGDSTKICAFSLQRTIGGPIGRAANPDTFEIVFWRPEADPPIDLAKSLLWHIGWIGGLAFARDGKLLASGSFDESLCVWDPHARTLLANSREHQGAVYGVSFSPDGATLASCSADRTVKLWSTRAADLRRLPEQPAPNTSLERVLATMLDTQGPGRSGLAVVAQDIVDDLARLDSSAATNAIRKLLTPIDPANVAIAFAVGTTIEVRREQARREGDTALAGRYYELASTLDAALSGADHPGSVAG